MKTEVRRTRLFWGARIVALLYVLWLLVEAGSGMVQGVREGFAEGSRTARTGAQSSAPVGTQPPTAGEAVVMACALVYFAGLLIGWKSELAGGVVTGIAAVIIGPLGGAPGVVKGGVQLVVMVFPAVLYLVSSHASRRAEGAPAAPVGS